MKHVQTQDASLVRDLASGGLLNIDTNRRDLNRATRAKMRLDRNAYDKLQVRLQLLEQEFAEFRKELRQCKTEHGI